MAPLVITDAPINCSPPRLFGRTGYIYILYIYVSFFNAIYLSYLGQEMEGQLPSW